MSDQDLLIEVRRRYELDPEFHALVYRAVDLLAQNYQQETGLRMSEDRHALARFAAGLGLVLRDQHVDHSIPPLHPQES